MPSRPAKGSGLPVLGNLAGAGAGEGSGVGATGAGAAATLGAFFGAGAGAGSAAATTGLGLATGAVPVKSVLAAISVMGSSTTFSPLIFIPFFRPDRKSTRLNSSHLGISY